MIPRRGFRLLMILFGGGALCAAEPEHASLWPDPAFQWGSRLFSRREAEEIIRLAPTPPGSAAEARRFIRSQQALLSGIVLCEQSGVTLSASAARRALELDLLTMPPERRRALEQSCRRNGLTVAAFLNREAGKLDRRFQCAIREWYKIAYPEERVSDAQVQDWYFRHQERFLTKEADPEALWLLPPGPDAPAQAAAWLKQGMPPDAVQRKFPVTVSPGAVAALLDEKGLPDTPEKGFTLYRGEHFQILSRAGAVRTVYRKLTPELAEAIRNALYDALAKARLAEALDKLGSGRELRFF